MSVLGNLKGIGTLLILLRRISGQNKNIIERVGRLEKKVDKLLKREKR